MKHVLLLVVVASIGAAWTAAALPVRVTAAIGWSLTAKPLTMPPETETDVRLRLTDTAAEFDIACLRLSIPDPMQVRDTRVTATSVDGEWDINASGSDPTQVEVFDKDGNASLENSDWVEFVIAVRPRGTGASAWTGDVFDDPDCEGPTLLPDVVLQFVVELPATGRPFITATPTPQLTLPTPTIRPTPVPTLPATATPTLPPTAIPTLATAIPTGPPTPLPTLPPNQTPTPRPTPTETSSATPAPTPTFADDATPTPLPSSPVQTPPDDGDASPPVDPTPPAPGAFPPPDSGTPPDSADGGGALGSSDDAPLPAADYQLPDSLYDAGDTFVGFDDPSATWIIPALVTGVPGLLVILLVVGHVALGLSWLPGVGRLLGPTPDEVDDRRHLWWAAGRPIT